MNKTVVVTGASRGIGRAVSIYYAQTVLMYAYAAAKIQKCLKKSDRRF